MTNSPQGFKDDSNGTIAGDPSDDYQYDSNGNMIKDENKKITGITYNHLNLPSKITFGTTGTINYLYDAAGVKLQKKVTQGTTVTTTDYLGGYQYTNNVLDFFPTAEGYVKRTLVSGVSYYNYVFNHTDHLGNVRVSYTKNPATGTLKIIEENHNYPFGLKHNYNTTDYQFGASGSGVVLSQVTENGYNYQYQGQERQDELNLNWDSFKWRNYDYAIGRFMSVDPLSEKYNYQSHYNFAENRVIDGRELEGLEWASIKNDDGTTTRQLTVQMYNNTGISDKQVNKLQESLKENFAKTFSGEGSTANLVIQNVSEAKGDFLVTLQDTKSNPIYDKETQEVVGKIFSGGKTGELGQTKKNSFDLNVSVNGSKRSNSEISRTFNHESGHTAGLEHPWEKSNPVVDIKQDTSGVKDSTVKKNLMNSANNPKIENRSTSGTNLTSGQFNSMDELIKKQQ